MSRVETRVCGSQLIRILLWSRSCGLNFYQLCSSRPPEGDNSDQALKLKPCHGFKNFCWESCSPPFLIKRMFEPTYTKWEWKGPREQFAEWWGKKKNWNCCKSEGAMSNGCLMNSGVSDTRIFIKIWSNSPFILRSSLQYSSIQYVLSLCR